MLRNQALRRVAPLRASLPRASATTPRTFVTTPARLAPPPGAKKQKQQLKPGELEEHARIFDPDARAGTAAEATSEGGDFTQSRPVDIASEGHGKRPTSGPVPPPNRQQPGTSSSSPAPNLDAGSGVDPGYSEPSAPGGPQPAASAPRPSASSDPFPLPFSSGVDLASPSQSDQLEDYGAPMRVPGREDGAESREVRIRRIIYQARKRGILETELLLSTFADKHLWQMPEAEIEEFDRLMDEPDWDIYYWLVDRKPVPDRWRDSFHTEGRLGARLRIHTKNEEGRLLRMPGEGPRELRK